MFSWNSNLTSLNYKGHQNFSQQKPWADRTRSLHIFVLKGGGGGDACFQVADEIFPSWRGSLKKICDGPAKDRQDEFVLQHIPVDFRTKMGVREAACACVEKDTASCVSPAILVRNHHLLREIMKSVPNFLFFYEKSRKQILFSWNATVISPI